MHSSLFQWALLALLLLPVHATAQESCTVLEACHRCTDGDRRDHPECQTTGIIAISKCTIDDNEDAVVYQVCQRTKADDEFLMIQLQVFCMILGIVSFLSVRRQKSTASSLFEQRQRMRTPKANSAIELGTTSKTRHEGTLSRLSSREEEKVPLTQQRLEVV